MTVNGMNFSINSIVKLAGIQVPTMFNSESRLTASIATSSMSTAGTSTLVVGGIYTATNSHSNSGVPWFRKIPIIGLLFSSDSTSESKAELFFFVTPRILNEKESGIEGKAGPTL